MQYIDYNNELSKINSLLVEEKYSNIIKEVGWLFEVALKDLYKKQISFFRKNIDNPILKEEYNKLLTVQNGLYPYFEIEKETFARIGWLFFKSNFNNLIELRINTPLTFSNQIPWSDIRKLRNTLVHSVGAIVERKDALKYIDYIKTYIHETKLSEHVIHVGELSCYSCDSLIDGKWKYCPSCGVDLSRVCKKCGKALKSEYVICPKCETPRSGVKLEKPKLVYKYYCQAVWSDGYLSSEENDFLKLKRNELGLDIIAAEKIESKHAPINAIRFRDSVETCLIDGIIDKKEKVYLKKFADDLSLSHELANSVYMACVNFKNEIPLFEYNY